MTVSGPHRNRILPPIVTVKVLARYLDISVRTLRRWRAAGRLPPPLNLGSTLRWRSGDIEQWLTQDERLLSSEDNAI